MKPLGTTDGPSLASAPTDEETGALAEELLEKVLSEANRVAALRRVRENKGAPGIDGMRVQELEPYLAENWAGIRQAILEGRYRPQPVRRVEIPKPGGGMRLLGVPTALDRLIQQMLHQVLSPIFDPGFSDRSYGFRPGRNAHQAVEKARQHIDEGYTWMVEIDAEKYFDRVNHDVLMARVERKVEDRRILRLIRLFLRSGVMVQGVVQETTMGTPQGGPLSPLLANILLDDLDKELEARGHQFVRYADDISVFVRSQKTGERVLGSLQRYLEQRLRIKVNRQKSRVDRPWRLKLLGFSFYRSARGTRIRIAPESYMRLKDKVRAITARSRSRSMAERMRELNQYLPGWMGYFCVADAKNPLLELDEWLRHRLRQCRLKEWKHPRTRYHELVKLGVRKNEARKISGSRKGTWRLSLTPQLHAAIDTAYWWKQGFTFASDLYSAR